MLGPAHSEAVLCNSSSMQLFRILTKKSVNVFSATTYAFIPKRFIHLGDIFKILCKRHENQKGIIDQIIITVTKRVSYLLEINRVRSFNKNCYNFDNLLFALLNLFGEQLVHGLLLGDLLDEGPVGLLPPGDAQVELGERHVRVQPQRLQVVLPGLVLVALRVPRVASEVEGLRPQGLRLGL